MARKLRIEYPGALHHVINRGNYRRDLFESVGAAKAFLEVLDDAAAKFGWRIHAYVLMNNHFHIAIETPQPTLGEGMHWLQSTIATRFNRLRSESGHLFQGRYKQLVIEDFAALARVVDYIHLNPCRAKVVSPEQVTGYRWSSLQALLRGPRPDGLVAKDWLQARGGWTDDQAGLEAYATYLSELAQDEKQWESAGLVGLSKGWAIGTHAWKKALAKAYAQQSVPVGLARDEINELRETRWEAALEDSLKEKGKSVDDLLTKPWKQEWKIALAREIRQNSGASIAWLATHLHLGAATSLRSYLHQAKKAQN